jgi:hypothetical protein
MHKGITNSRAKCLHRDGKKLLLITCRGKVERVEFSFFLRPANCTVHFFFAFFSLCGWKFPGQKVCVHLSDAALFLAQTTLGASFYFFSAASGELQSKLQSFLAAAAPRQSVKPTFLINNKLSLHNCQVHFNYFALFAHVAATRRECSFKSVAVR